jgi:NTE family protein
MLLVSDAGQKIAAEKSPRWNWLCHLIRAMNLMDDQVRSQRKRTLMAAYLRPGPEGRTGAYWSIRSTFADLAAGSPLADPLGLANFDPRLLAEVSTRLGRMKPRRQERLINWGYAVCDTALRRWASEELVALGVQLRDPPGLPYPNTPLTT